MGGEQSKGGAESAVQVAPKYFLVRKPKRPVLVNGYTLVDGRLVNVNRDDALAESEDPAAGTQIIPQDIEVFDDGQFYACIAFPREFMGGMFYAMTSGKEQRAMLVMPCRGGFYAHDGAAEIKIEEARRAKWAKRSLYHLPGGLWVREGDTLRRYMPLGGVDARGAVSFSAQTVMEESNARKQGAVTVLRDRDVTVLRDGGAAADRTHFIECEHGLVAPHGWVVTLRKIDGDETVLGKKTPLGVRTLTRDETDGVVAALASESRAAPSARADSAAALRGAGGACVLGSLSGQGAVLVLELAIGGRTHTYAMRWFDKGSFNLVGVPAVGGVEADVVIRLSAKMHPSLVQFEREARFAKELGRRGIGPEIYATLYVGVQRGFAMERFPHTLYDAAMCPYLMRKALVESDGESALVGLYMRSSGLIRCTDTKSANVVVRFDPLRLALIDVDPKFCVEQPYVDRVPEPFGVEELDAALGREDGQAYAAATSLLVHCIEAAKIDNQKFGYGYPRIARCLLGHMAELWPVVSADGSRHSAMAMMTAYYKHKRAILTQEMVVIELERAVSIGAVIELCRGPPHLGELYERAAMAFLRKRYLPYSTTPEGLLREVEEHEADEKLRPDPPLGCGLALCARHPHPVVLTKRHRDADAASKFGQWI
jgi:hypothetical protein